ncbi:Kelch-like protein 5 [Chelonia mydas]|uniref:Kelch-like protein 5 n=1 Tax=Chelonia mydas TaxID=8469 RepID=M7BD70_CHEMY|nr:Kelch-like protein 5 [Chelonia mydas]
MSGSRKEFDVKQILKIRWRWFGHQSSIPNSGMDSHREDFWNRGENATTGGTKFLDPGNLPLPLASIGYRRSSQQDFQNSPPWPMASTSEVPTFEFTTENCGDARCFDRSEADDGASEEENESDSSSCRTSNSSQTLSSCQTMEPCTSDEFFQALNHAEQTFKKMENYLRHKQLCDVVLVAGDRRIPAHSYAGLYCLGIRQEGQETLVMDFTQASILLLDVWDYPAHKVYSAGKSMLVQFSGAFTIPSVSIHVPQPTHGLDLTIQHPRKRVKFLADMENNALFKDDIECQKLIMEAMKYHLLPERRPMLQSPRTKPRKSTVGVLFAVGGMDATKGCSAVSEKVALDLLGFSSS